MKKLTRYQGYSFSNTDLTPIHFAIKIAFKQNLNTKPIMKHYIHETQKYQTIVLVNKTFSNNTIQSQVYFYHIGGFILFTQKYHDSII